MKYTTAFYMQNPSFGQFIKTATDEKLKEHLLWLASRLNKAGCNHFDETLRPLHGALKNKVEIEMALRSSIPISRNFDKIGRVAYRIQAINVMWGEYGVIHL